MGFMRDDHRRRLDRRSPNYPQRPNRSTSNEIVQELLDGVLKVQKMSMKSFLLWYRLNTRRVRCRKLFEGSGRSSGLFAISSPRVRTRRQNSVESSI